MATRNEETRFMKGPTRMVKAPWAISLAAMVSVLLQPACTVCTCKVPPVTPGTAPTASNAAAAPASGGNLKGSVPYNWKNVAILGGGFVSGIVYSPVQKDLVFARTDVGGAYRFDPDHKVWVALTDQLGRDSNFIGIESLAADPVDANKVYLAAGTYTGSWVGNGAILRSNDRGNTWQTIDMPVKMGGNENGRSMGERLAIDPNLTQHPLLRLAQGGPLEEQRLGVDLGQGRQLHRLRQRQGDRHPDRLLRQGERVEGQGDADRLRRRRQQRRQPLPQHRRRRQLEAGFWPAQGPDGQPRRI